MSEIAGVPGSADALTVSMQTAAVALAQYRVTYVNSRNEVWRDTFLAADDRAAALRVGRSLSTMQVNDLGVRVISVENAQVGRRVPMRLIGDRVDISPQTAAPASPVANSSASAGAPDTGGLVAAATAVSANPAVNPVAANAGSAAVTSSVTRATDSSAVPTDEGSSVTPVESISSAQLRS